MDEIEEFVDERNKSWCIHCGSWLSKTDTNRDHVPTKGLLLKPHPENLPVVRVCENCNSGFSRDEEYVIAFLNSVVSGSTDPESQATPTAKSILGRSSKLRSRIEKAKTVTRTLFGEEDTSWEPEWDRINRIILKNARGHAYFEMGEPMLQEPTHVISAPLQSLSPEKVADFETCYAAPVWPEVGSRMMTRVLTGQDLVDGWVVVQEGAYRYVVEQVGIMRVKTVLWEYLATEVYWGAG